MPAARSHAEFSVARPLFGDRMSGVYWTWSVTRETQAFDVASQRPHGFGWGVITAVVLVVAMVVGLIALPRIAEWA
jgi:hypothetical protein